MHFRFKIFLLLGIMILSAGCRSWQEPAAVSESEPGIFPDYSDVTVPANIAPMNFMVEGASCIQAAFSTGEKEIVRIIGDECVISVPEKDWKKILEAAEGTYVSVEVSVWNDEFPEGVRYRPFRVNVSGHEIDPYVAYRLIEPGYRSWRQISLCQRDLSSFEESTIVSNSTENETCLNCHHFPSYSSESMMFHARGANGGTVLYKDGRLEKIDFRNIGPKMNTTYPAWHPGGRYIAFSSNTTHQIFFVHGEQPVEVYDDASDLLLYDTETGKVVTDPRFTTPEVFETFPSWSPDGRYLYYVAADGRKMPEEVRDMQYHILRVGFDEDNACFEERTDTIYNAYVSGGSASYPRVSADGRYLLYTWSEYGTFPVWHKDADLRMIDLESMEHTDVSVWNEQDEADSYHSWSSDGRWVIFGSRRLDGRYTRLYIAHLDDSGRPHKPFLLPQEDPRHNLWRLKSYNVPEFIDGKVELPDDVVELFETEK